MHNCQFVFATDGISGGVKFKMDLHPGIEGGFCGGPTDGGHQIDNPTNLISG